MRAAHYHGNRTFKTALAPMPVPKDGEVLLRVRRVGICGTDLHIYRGEFRARVKLPAIQGHEFGGTVVDTGKGVTGWRRGDRVAVDPIVSCHACAACLAGQLNCCRALKLRGSTWRAASASSWPCRPATSTPSPTPSR